MDRPNGLSLALLLVAFLDFVSKFVLQGFKDRFDHVEAFRWSLLLVPSLRKGHVWMLQLSTQAKLKEAKWKTADGAERFQVRPTII